MIPDRVVSNNRLRQALIYRAETDLETPEAKGRYLEAKKLAKEAYAIAIKSSEGKNAENRAADAELDEDYKAAYAHEIKMMIEHDYLVAKRETEKMMKEVWQSEDATIRATVGL